METTAALTDLTNAELGILAISVYRSAVRLYDRATAIHTEMAKIATWTPAYHEMKAETALIIAAAREQNELHSELIGITRARRENVQAV